MIRTKEARSSSRRPTRQPTSHGRTNQNQILVEPLEGRQHRSDTVAQQILNSDTIIEPSGALFWGLAIYGGNGQEGPAGVSVGDSSETLAWGCNVWDSNLSNGFDTGNVSFSFAVDLMGTDYMEFETSYSDAFGAYNTTSDATEITMIDIRAAVADAEMKVAVGTFTVSFFSGGVFQETVTVDGPHANRLNQTTPGAKQEIVRLVVDEDAHYDRAIITGTFRMQANQGVEPQAEDLVFDVHVYAA